MGHFDRSGRFNDNILSNSRSSDGFLKTVALFTRNSIEEARGTSGHERKDDPAGPARARTHVAGHV